MRREGDLGLAQEGGRPGDRPDRPPSPRCWDKPSTVISCARRKDTGKPSNGVWRVAPVLLLPTCAAGDPGRDINTSSTGISESPGSSRRGEAGGQTPARWGTHPPPGSRRPRPGAPSPSPVLGALRDSRDPGEEPSSDPRVVPLGRGAARQRRVPGGEGSAVVMQTGRCRCGRIWAPHWTPRCCSPLSSEQRATPTRTALRSWPVRAGDPPRPHGRAPDHRTGRTERLPGRAPAGQQARRPVTEGSEARTLMTSRVGRVTVRRTVPWPPPDPPGPQKPPPPPCVLGRPPALFFHHHVTLLPCFL